MVDRIDAARRSLNMSRIRSRDTRPELVVRRIAHRLGYRFRLHRADLPGTPDLVFPSLRLAMLIHGCFWHRHEGCARTTIPSTRPEFWLAKFDANRQRDQRTSQMLKELGWRVQVIWECETKDIDALQDRLATLLGSMGKRQAREPSIVG